VARPESEPKTPLGSRLRQVRRELGDNRREEFAEQLEISKDSLALYERGENVPSATVLAEYHRKFGINLNWLATGQGGMFFGDDVKVGNVTLAEVREFVWNIAATFWKRLPRRTKSEAFADQFVEMLDYLVSREGLQEGAASEVIHFAAEQRKRASGQDET